jgi:methionyl-tRNA synthetase
MKALASAGAFFLSAYALAMRYGYHCEECEEAVWPATSRAELNWLRNREHIVREVAQHVQGGLDTWITDGLEFLSRHAGHSIVLTRRP